MRRTVLVLACLALGLAAPLAAQDVSLDYTIGPKDMLEVRVLELPELAVERRVSDSGTLELPLLGEIPVSGLTAPQVRSRIEKLLTAKYVNHADVSIVVKEFANKPVSVLGAVMKPGILAISGRWTLMNAITAAGGLNDHAGRKIVVLRHAENGLSDTLEINAEDLFGSTTPIAALPILPGDVINIPPRVTFTVFCLGEVKAPGAINFDSDDRLSLLSLIAKAGGLSDRASKMIRIKRRGPDGKDVEKVVDFKRVVSGQEPDYPLEPNDVVVVKESFF